MGLAYVPLEGGRRYFWSAKEHDLSLLGRYGGIVIESVNGRAEIEYRSSSPVKVPVPAAQTFPSVLSVTSSVLGPYIHSRRGMLRGVTFRNILFVGYVGSAAVAGHYTGMNIVANDVRFENCEWWNEESADYDATALSPYKAMENRNITTFKCANLGEDKWVQPNSELARGCANVEFVDCFFQGEPLGETSGATGVVTAVYIRKATNVLFRGRFGYYSNPYDRVISDVIFTGNPANNDALIVRDYDAWQEKREEVVYSIKTTPTSNESVLVSFDAVPADNQKIVIDSNSGTAKNIIFKAAVESDTATDFYVDTTGLTTAQTVSAANTKINAISGLGATSSVISNTHLRIVDSTAGENLTLAVAGDGTNTLKAATTATAATIRRNFELTRGASKEATMAALVSSISRNQAELKGALGLKPYHHEAIASGGYIFTRNLASNEMTPASGLACCRIQQKAIGDVIDVPPTYTKALYHTQDSGTHVSELIDGGSAITIRAISHHGNARRRVGAWYWGVVTEDTTHKQGWQIIGCDYFYRAPYSDRATLPHNDFIPYEWSEGGHLTWHIEGEGIVVVDGVADLRGSGFGKLSARVGQVFVASETTAGFRVRSGTNKAFRLTFSGTPADTGTVTVNDGELTATVFEWDQDADGVTTGRVAVATGSTYLAAVNLRKAIRARQMAGLLQAYAGEVVDLGNGSFTLDVTLWTHSVFGSPTVSESSTNLAAAEISQPYRNHSMELDINGHWISSGASTSPWIRCEDVYASLNIKAQLDHIRHTSVTNLAQAYQQIFIGNGFPALAVPADDSDLIVNDGVNPAVTFRAKAGGGTDTDVLKHINTTTANTYALFNAAAVAAINKLNQQRYRIAFSGATVDDGCILDFVCSDGVIRRFQTGAGTDTQTLRYFVAGNPATTATNFVTELNAAFGVTGIAEVQNFGTGVVLIPRKMGRVEILNIIERADPSGEVAMDQVPMLNAYALDFTSTSFTFSILSGNTGVNATFVTKTGGDSAASIGILNGTDYGTTAQSIGLTTNVGSNGSATIANQGDRFPIVIYDCTNTKITAHMTPFASSTYSGTTFVEQWSDSASFPTLEYALTGTANNGVYLHKSSAGTNMRVVFEGNDWHGPFGAGRIGAKRAYDCNSEFDSSGQVVIPAQSNFINGLAL